MPEEIPELSADELRRESIRNMIDMEVFLGLGPNAHRDPWNKGGVGPRWPTELPPDPPLFSEAATKDQESIPLETLYEEVRGGIRYLMVKRELPEDEGKPPVELACFGPADGIDSDHAVTEIH